MSKKKEFRRVEFKAEKRKIELLRKKKRTKKMMAMSVMLIAIISIVIIIAMSMDAPEHIKEPELTQSSTVVSQTEVSIPLSDVSTDAKFIRMIQMV